MKTSLLRLTATLALSFLGCRAVAADFSTAYESYYEDYLALFPIDAATNGDSDPRYEGVWQNDISDEHRAKEADMVQKHLAQLAKFDRSQLSDEDQLNYDILKWTLELRVAGLAQPTHLLPISQFASPALMFAQMGSGSSLHPFKSAKDYRNFIKRAEGFSGWISTAIANMRVGIERGIVQPRVLMQRTLSQYEPLMFDDPEKNLFYTPLRSLPSNLSADEATALRADYVTAIKNTIIPAYSRLHAFIKNEYIPRCRETSGLSAIPGGREMYAYWVRNWTTTDRAPDDIHELGLREVARIRGEMEKVMQRVEFKGTVTEFISYVAKEPKFAPFKSSEEILNAYRSIEARLTPSLPKLFNRIPKTPFEIRETEKFRAATASVEYQPAAADGSRPGIFYVPIVSPDRIRVPDMEYLFLHEAIPGHHFQFSTTLEKPDLPRFRRFGWSSAYGEGWGLYAESLGTDLGLYTDPYQYFGGLRGEMHRAIRLVVDTGLHAKGWTREQALAFSAQQQGAQPRDVADIERYMAAPGQALSYKIGQLKIIELRNRARQKLGPRFDVRDFHQRVLDDGSVPLAVLESRIDAWIRQIQKRPC
jgi:uncharacterized protein (DUF885 family)